MHSILLHMKKLPLITVQFILTRVYTPMYIMRTNSVSYIVVPYVCFLLMCHCAVDLNIFSLLTSHTLALCCVIFWHMPSKVIYNAHIPLSSDIFLDNFVSISMQVLSSVFVFAIVMLAF